MKIIQKTFENEIETLWESEEKNHNDDPFMTVKKSRGYYIYAERVGKDSIAFILYDRKKQKFGLIKESKPSMDGDNYKAYMVTAFGGSIDMEDRQNYQQICQVEVVEETGYEVSMERIHTLGKTLVSTQMSQMCELFFVDITDIEKSMTAEWEDSDSLDAGEERVLWMSRDEVMENGDWKSVYIMVQAEFRSLIKEQQ